MSLYTDAVTFFETEKLRTDAWDVSPVQLREKALAEALSIIGNLKLTITLEDPYPTNIKKAIFEIAYSLLDGEDPDQEVKNLAALGLSNTSVRNIYDRRFALPHIRHGVPSARAWVYLKPYLADPRNLTLERIG